MKRFTCSSGEYLAIEPVSDGYVIGWYLPDEDEIGSVLGERGGDRETVIAEKVVREYFEKQGWELPCEGRNFVIPTESRAKEVKSLCEVALHNNFGEIGTLNQQQYSCVWSAIDAVVTALGGDASKDSDASRKAVTRVEKEIEALIRLRIDLNAGRGRE